MTALQIPLIIPSLEPDDRLPKLLSALRAAHIENIVLVDDGSGKTYRSYFDNAEQIGCVVLRHDVNKGKGRALKTAFEYCLAHWPDAPGCVTADSDGQHTPECIIRCMEALAEHPNSLVLGCRNFDAPGVPEKSKKGNKLTCFMFRLLVGLKVSDTQTGLRGISTDFMRHLLNTSGERFEFESNMLIDAKDLNIPVWEVPIETVYDSKENHTTHFHPVRDSIRIYSIFGKRFGKFLLSSLSSSVVDLVCFAVFCRIFAGGLFGLNYIMTSTVLARLISATYNFLINYRLVFKSNGGYLRSALKYCLLAIFTMTCSGEFVSLLFALTHGPEVLLKAIVDTTLFFVSYHMQREFVYKRKNAKTPQKG